MHCSKKYDKKHTVHENNKQKKNKPSKRYIATIYVEAVH